MFFWVNIADAASPSKAVPIEGAVLEQPACRRLTKETVKMAAMNRSLFTAAGPPPMFPRAITCTVSDLTCS